jgi:hypothetical protein
VAGILLIGLALAGVVSSPRHHARATGKSSGAFPFEFCQRHVPNISIARKDRVLWLAVAGSVLLLVFWVC